jgi:hypothetical protein
MCTVTIFPLPSTEPNEQHGSDRIRLACNRDESLMRPRAIPPHVRQIGARQAVFPIDPAGGGTWIAANDAGLVFTLLNFNVPTLAPELASRSQLSRGLIIPTLLDCPTQTIAVDRLLALDVSRYAAFRLVITNCEQFVEVVSTGKKIQIRNRKRLYSPLLFTSSGLGDAVVESPRSSLLQQILSTQAASSAVQDSFHRHSWPRKQHLSVCMRRPDARTVSYTTVEMSRDRAVMQYHAGAPDRGAANVSLSLRIGELGRRRLAMVPPTNRHSAQSRAAQDVRSQSRSD